ncbi:uncharacterized protein TRIADDRAFT_63655 [Trichoplax adhaerens]|uniref:Uncharacterized protein n=1 Tax=Trichoplax adhaerens TaxID=10228 RepID=B3RP72_TRIAD|nr:hypothetical protein TRIADDRAFT_63655 [Trichoplax adhaerens]EDV27583.1 hypothetical protein TRIADDRAFT_63655 [Trichoplax adhaerens]|eukprot:XP_002109417.1 hypothetical protein TRIADDRAFT_63655 [Trichoplax adhaerens]
MNGDGMDILSRKPNFTQSHDEQFAFGDTMLSEGCACFSYLIFVCHICTDSIPWIYSYQYRLYFNLRHVEVFLKSSMANVIDKGLELYKFLLNNIPSSTLPAELTSSRIFRNNAQNLLSIMSHYQQEAIRKKSYNVFQSKIDKCQGRGKYLLIKYLLTQNDHPGIIELLTLKLKDGVTSALNDSEVRFAGKHELLETIKVILQIKDDVDIVNEANRFLAGLNFVKFLLLRDNVQDNKTGIWGDVTDFKCHILEPLRKELRNSHTRLEIDLQSLQKSKQGNSDSMMMNRNDLISHLPFQDQIQIMYSKRNNCESIIPVQIEESSRTSCATCTLYTGN